MSKVGLKGALEGRELDGIRYNYSYIAQSSEGIAAMLQKPVTSGRFTALVCLVCSSLLWMTTALPSFASEPASPQNPSGLEDRLLRLQDRAAAAEASKNPTSEPHRSLVSLLKELDRLEWQIRSEDQSHLLSTVFDLRRKLEAKLLGTKPSATPRSSFARVQRSEKATPVVLNGSDFCQDAPLITAGTYISTTTGATADGSDNCSIAGGSPDVWYRYNPTEQETYFRLAADSFRSVLSIHFECPTDESTYSICASDYGEGVVRYNYYLNGPTWIRIAGYIAETGDYELQLGHAGIIQGHVTSAETGQPLDGFVVSSEDISGNQQDFDEWTDSTGFYRFDRYFGGVRQVSVRGNGYVNEIFEGVVCLEGDRECSESSGTPVEVAINSVQTIDFELQKGGSISGRVVAGDTFLPLQTLVRAENSLGYTEASIDTAEDGSYTLTGLPPGSYAVRVSGPDGYVTQIWDGINCPSYCSHEDGRPIIVAQGQAVDDIDFQLQQWARISGTVRDAQTGEPLIGEGVNVRSESGFPNRSANTDGNGRFQINGLQPGSYLMTAGSNYDHLTVLHPDLPCDPGSGCDWDQGTLFELDFDAEIDGVDFELNTGGTITGRITVGSTGQPAQGTTVWARRTDFRVTKSAYVQDNGTFEIRGLHDGQYWIYTSDFGSSANGVDTVYPDLVCTESQCPFEEGTPVPVTVGQTTPGIDFALRSFSRLSGRVTESGGLPIEQVSVYLSAQEGDTFLTAFTDSNGNYAFEQLYPGAYRVETSALNHLNEIYDDIPCPFPNRMCPSATPVEVALESEVTGIDFQLDQGGRIAGTVTDRFGEPIFGNINIEILDEDGLNAGFGGDQDFNGEWRSRPLPQGTYSVRTRSFTDYENMIWNGNLCPMPWQDCPTLGDPIPVVDGETSGGIHLGLPRLARITGRVIDADTGEPVSGQVNLWTQDGELHRTGSIDDFDSLFKLGYLRPGTYYLTTQAEDGHLDRVLGGGLCFGPDCDPTSGTPLTVNYDQIISDLEISLETGGQIVGTIVSDTGDPESGVPIRLFDSQGRQVRDTQSINQGIWTFRGVPAGTYYVQARSSGNRYFHQLWGGIHCYHSCDPTQGSPIRMQEQGLVTGIDLAFDEQFGSIEGRVTHAGTGEPISRILVRRWAEDLTWLDLTDTDGRYSFSRVSDVPTRLSTDAAPDWLDQVWPGIPCPVGCEQELEQGEAIVVPAETNLTGFDFALEPAQGCDDPAALCLGNDRFRAYATWKTDTEQGVGTAVPLTDDSGYFHFFSPDNVEVLVKVLDACDFNGAYWVFAAGLTNLEVELRVLDLASGQERRYTSQGGQTFAPIQDTEAFSECAGSSPIESPTFERQTVDAPLELGKALTCTPDDTTVCLTDGRFQVEMIRDTSAEDPMPAYSEMLTTDTAYFWFFSPSNVEVLVKVLDACEDFDQFWIFTSGLTDVGTTLTITDTQTGQTWTRETQLDQPYPPVIETEAFTCP